MKSRLGTVLVALLVLIATSNVEAFAATVLSVDTLDFAHEIYNLSAERKIADQLSLEGLASYTGNTNTSFYMHTVTGGLGANYYFTQALEGPYMGAAAMAMYMAEGFRSPSGYEEHYRNTVLYGAAKAGYKIQAGNAIIDLSVVAEYPFYLYGSGELHPFMVYRNSVEFGIRF